MEKKGQASMEFLMTYGWAILAAVLAIGVLAYYGVFSPSKSLPDLCTMSAPFGCDEYQVTTSDVTVIIANGGGDSVWIQNLTITGCASDSATGWNISDGNTESLIMTCASTLTEDSKFSGKISVEYLRAGKTITQTASGDIRATVQA